MKTWKSLAIVLFIVFCNFIVAQEASENSANTESMLSLIVNSGILGWLIIILSVIMVGWTTYCIMNIRRDKLIPTGVLQEVEDLLDEESYEEVMEICISEPTFFTNVISASLPKIEDGYDSMITNAQASIEEETIKLQQKISWLQLIAAVGPMLGLLGTVTGMIEAFRTIASSTSSPKPSALAGGIYKALITTCLGLGVAIIAMCVFFYFRNFIVKMTMEITGIVEELFDRFRKVNEEN